MVYLLRVEHRDILRSTVQLLKQNHLLKNRNVFIVPLLLILQSINLKLLGIFP